MKIVMLTSNTALSGKIILQKLIKNDLTPAAVIIERYVSKEGNPLKEYYTLLKKKLKKLGWSHVAGKCFRLLLGKSVIQKKIEYMTLNDLARLNNVLVRKVSNFNSQECRAFLFGLRPDICTVSGTRILKKEIFRIPPRGCINFHTGLLPKYRGSDTIIWSLYNNDPVGVTIHKIAEKLDAGEVILEGKVSISPTDRYKDIYKKACELGAKMIIKILSDPDYYLNNTLNKYNSAFPIWRKAPREIVQKVREMRHGYL